jgi:hypothetical protein
MDVAIDPGLTATGVVVLKDGEIRGSHTYYGKHQGYMTKMGYIGGCVVKMMADYADVLGPVETVVVEDFVRYYPKTRMDSLAKMFELTGYLQGLIAGAFPGAQIVRVGKGTASKSSAAWIAAAAKLTGSAHVRDAYHLAVLAGIAGKR